MEGDLKIKRKIFRYFFPIAYLIGFVVTFLCCLNLGHANASSWPMFNYNPAHTGYNPVEKSIYLPLKKTWIYYGDRYNEGRSRPTVANGTVYIGTQWYSTYWWEIVGRHGRLKAIDAQTGIEKWCFSLDESKDGPNVGILTTPVVYDGYVYFGSRNGKLYALDAETGEFRWSYLAPSLILASPTVCDGIVYFSCWGSGMLYALDAKTGNLRWAYDVGSILWSSPAVSEGVVYFGADKIYALDARTGELKWSYSPRYGRVSSASPVVFGDRVYVLAGYDIFALDKDNGDLKWKYFHGDYYGDRTAPSVAYGNIYFTVNGNLHVLDADTGVHKWDFNWDTSYKNRMRSSPAIADGYVFLGASRDPVDFFDASDGRLYVLDAHTGELLWSYSNGRHFNDWYAIDPSPVVAEGMVFANLSTKIFLAFKSSKPLSIISDISVSPQVLDPYKKDERATLHYDLNKEANLTLEILNSSKHIVKSIDLGTKEPGSDHYEWWGVIDCPEIGLNDDKGVFLAPDGEYTIRLTAQDIEDGSVIDTKEVKVQVETSW
ncbi:PQQ-binding-like beta-propeller repeat protein [Candidatus Oleimmundimicrobium sp.]|uniref:outer membrane protein assembly factor BamB family protein n=1 Tax=Candidatus Oleimmundimicrobium sp. TaxID=3060597 RepID=UPI00271B4662|nr:PQQ-binding-like beta-propeller repeat protein [Candidatus Oleimmundimicrobium sp.]MDO8886573.1 PQQ-binding-like beta-propeller repeat protein [Candidatus Oleimmundimicrobium sp.]